MVMTRKDWIHAGEVIIIGLLFFVVLAIASVGAISWGDNLNALNYSVNALPNNSYVHQGENISQGNYYDLSGIYGFSGVIASWKDDYNSGITQPDYVVVLSYPRNTYIDPATFPAGRYYQWDGGYCKDSSDCTNSFGHANAYVFAIAGPIKMTQQNRTVVHYVNITEQVGNQTIQVPVTYTEVITGEMTLGPAIAEQQTINLPQTTAPINTPQEGPTAQNVVDINGDPVNGISGNVQQVTPNSPVPIWITGFAILTAIGIVIWRRKK
jgi:hypothetical protein